MTADEIAEMKKKLDNANNLRLKIIVFAGLVCGIAVSILVPVCVAYKAATWIPVTGSLTLCLITSGIMIASLKWYEVQIYTYGTEWDREHKRLTEEHRKASLEYNTVNKENFPRRNFLNLTVHMCEDQLYKLHLHRLPEKLR